MTEFCKHGVPKGVCTLGEKDCKLPSVAELNDEYLRDTYMEGLSQPAQEIVRKVFDIDNFHSSVLDRIKFTSPQQWQGLSDDAIVKELERLDEYTGKSFFAGVRWAEQALREKNNG